MVVRILNFPFSVSTFEILHLLKGMLWFCLSMIVMWDGNYEIVDSVIDNTQTPFFATDLAGMPQADCL